MGLNPYIPCGTLFQDPCGPARVAHTHTHTHLRDNATLSIALTPVLPKMQVYVKGTEGDNDVKSRI